ncbi:uncharacterized protein F5147DRAFT_800342 [Suillus discolor]|uniref:Uncharacterized protein n=1 Tax=Suillus discolor TaxID=1912936 RepID=A0A9P7F793_9AGAM|nr:uncharacterized protein F5147DRAFT_800342 [Suillus discolor]KAG2107947.1 hypothetical protein F5147DRAFT_800342 [Suillus discolor]
MPESPASSSGTPNPGNHYQPLELDLPTISCNFAMAGSRVRACIAQYQREAVSNVPSADKIMYFKAGLKWEMNTFVTPVLQYSASKNILSVVPVPVAYILKLYLMLTWNTVPDDIFSSHLLAFDDESVPGHPSRIVQDYVCPWWMGNARIPDEPWQWDLVIACCIKHYQCWAYGVEDDGIILPEIVKDTSFPPLVGLRWIRERMVALMEEQDDGIQAKMGEVEMYTEMLERLKRAKGV